MQSSKRIYDDMLSVGYVNGIPVTTASRLAQYKILALALHEQYKDMIHAGGCVVEGIDYSYLRLNKRVNIAGVDGDGNAQTTGWENINAVLTDVEYNYGEEETTQLTFSSDQMEFLGWDIGMLKDRMGIMASSAVNFFQSQQIVTSYSQSLFSGTKLAGDTAIVSSQSTLFYNPAFGYEAPIV
jgi:hypothetical protein